MRHLTRAPALVKTNFRGHYGTVNHNFGDTPTYITRLINGKGLWQKNLVGVQHRAAWKTLEPSKGVYNFAPVSAYLAQCAAHAGAGANGKTQMVLMIEDKVFSPPDAFPDYLFTEGFTSSRCPPGGTSASFRSNPYVVDRYLALLQAFGAYRDAVVPNGFDKHPNFEGLTIQESAIGPGGPPGAGGQDVAYTAARYTTAIKRMAQGISDIFPRCRTIWFANFIPGGQLAPPNSFDEILDLLVTLGGHLAGPDILHTNATLNRTGSVPEGIYQYYALYKDRLDAAGSMQNDSYREPKASGGLYSMQEQYDMAVGRNGETTVGLNPHQLFVKRVFWDFRPTTGTEHDWSDAVAVMDAHPEFNIPGTVKV